MLVSMLMVVAIAGTDARVSAWEEVKVSDGIRVRAREVTDTEVREIEADVMVPTTLERVAAILDDTEHYSEYMPYVQQARKMGALDDGHYEYMLIDPPLVDAREYTVRVKIEGDAETGIIKRCWTAANDKGPPPRKDTVRLGVNYGCWTLARQGDQTRITYYIGADPGGSIPKWIAKRANTQSIPDLLSAVRNRAVNPQWKRD